MSADHFFQFLLIFGASVLFLWLIGAACFFRSGGLRSFFHAPWLGYGLLVGSLQVTHLFFPVDRRFSTAFLAISSSAAVGVLALSLFVKGLPRKANVLRGLGWIILLGAVALIAFVPVFNSCTKEMNRYDLGLYYLKTIRWIEGFAIVPGLSNVQDHLGFNQSAFLATSFFDSLMPHRWGLFLVGGILPWLGLTLSLFAIVRLALSRFMRDEHAQPIEVAYAVSLPAWIFIFVGGDTSSATPDCTSACLMLHFFLIFACFMLAREQERRNYLGEILFLGALCICIKLNTLGLVAGIWALCVVTLLLGRQGALFFQRQVVVVASISIFMLTTWMGRGVLISGYPFFPSSALAMPVEWRTPAHASGWFPNLGDGLGARPGEFRATSDNLALGAQLAQPDCSRIAEPIHLACANWPHRLDYACDFRCFRACPEEKPGHLLLLVYSPAPLHDVLVSHGSGTQILWTKHLDLCHVPGLDVHCVRCAHRTRCQHGQSLFECVTDFLCGFGVPLVVVPARAAFAARKGCGDRARGE